MGNHGSFSQSFSSISNAVNYPDDIIQNKLDLKYIRENSANRKSISHEISHDLKSYDIRYEHPPIHNQQYLQEGEVEPEDSSTSDEDNEDHEESNDHDVERSISRSITLMGSQQINEKLNFVNNNNNNNKILQDTSNDSEPDHNYNDNDPDMFEIQGQVQGAQTLMGFETPTYDDNNEDDESIDSVSHSAYLPALIHKYGGSMDEWEEKDGEYSWWSYTFRAKNKYMIHIHFKIKGTSYSSTHPGVFNKKYGARFCSINGYQADIISFDNSNEKISHNVNEYDNNEYIILKMNRNIYRLFFIRRMGWCFDDGHGLYTNIKRVINGKLDK